MLLHSNFLTPQLEQAMRELKVAESKRADAQARVTICQKRLDRARRRQNKGSSLEVLMDAVYLAED